MHVQFPSGYMQARDLYRTYEPERRLYQYLQEFFRTVVTWASGVLFGKSVADGTDPWQFEGTVQISSHSNTVAPTLNFVHKRLSGPELSGDVLGALVATGYDGTNLAQGGGLSFYSSETWNGAAHGTGIKFKTIPTGTAAIQDSGGIYPSGSWATGVAVTSGSTSGFCYVPSSTGAPTGAPEVVTGRSPLYIDTAASKMYFHDGTNWIILN